MDDFLASIFSKSLFLSNLVIQWVTLVKNYWEKKFKKELEEEQTKLENEVNNAVKKKLDELEEPES